MSFLSFIFSFNVIIKLRNTIPDGVSTALYTAHTVDTIYTLLTLFNVYTSYTASTALITQWQVCLYILEYVLGPIEYGNTGFMSKKWSGVGGYSLDCCDY